MRLNEMCGQHKFAQALKQLEALTESAHGFIQIGPARIKCTSVTD